MAEIPIWPGSSSFAITNNPTPFGFYDDDTDFIEDADKVSQWCAHRLGYPLVDVELQPINLYSCFEEAVNEYGSQIYTYQIRDNIGKLVGSVTSSNQWDDLNQVNINDDFGQNFQGSGLGSNSQTGGTYGAASSKTYSASLHVKVRKQKYDLIDTTLVSWETGSAQIQTGDLGVKIQKIYHYAPAAINRYFDALKIQAIELNDTIRKSGYHYEIEQDRYLKLFPIPTSDYTLWFDYTISLGSQGGGIDPITGNAAALNTITDMSNVPYNNPTYKFLNSPARQWIRKYALALAKEMLGSVRGKYQSLPIPGSETTLDYSRLLSEASEEKTALITSLREDLENVSTENQFARTANENENKLTAQTSEGRYQIYIH